MIHSLTNKNLESFYSLKICLDELIFIHYFNINLIDTCHNRFGVFLLLKSIHLNATFSLSILIHCYIFLKHIFIQIHENTLQSLFRLSDFSRVFLAPYSLVRTLTKQIVDVFDTSLRRYIQSPRKVNQLFKTKLHLVYNMHEYLLDPVLIKFPSNTYGGLQDLAL